MSHQLICSHFSGKLAEGVDLREDKSRGVIIVGIPYTYRKDPLVAMKMEYLSRKKIGGNAWYQHTAFRAVNQALGRTIRHQNDYGAMILLDERFVNSQDLLPGWIAQNVEIVTQFGSSVKSTAQFFKFHQKAGELETYYSRFTKENRGVGKAVEWFELPVLENTYFVLKAVVGFLYTVLISFVKGIMVLFRSR